jgi:hypothetical protein
MAKTAEERRLISPHSSPRRPPNYSDQTGTDSPGIFAQRTSLKIFFFCEGVMARLPILRIHASSSLTEEVFAGTETVLRVLREVVMKDFGIRVQRGDV